MAATYVFENRDSGIVRVRSGDVGVSLLAGHTVVLEKGTAIYRLGLDAIAIDGGFAEHNSTTTTRGSVP